MDEWWYVSSPKMTFAVNVENDVVIETAPIARRFVGQSPKRLGAWLRSQGEVRFVRLTGGRAGTSPPRQRTSGSHSPLPEAIFTYAWGNNEKRAALKGRRCRIVARGKMRSVLVEFDNGQREVVSYRALRKENS